MLKIRWIPAAAPLLAAIGLLAAPADTGLPAMDWEKIAKNASERTEVTLDGPLLKSVAGFVAQDKKDAADLETLLTGLEGIYVHAYEFDEDNAYPRDDIEALRSHLGKNHWGRIVQSIDRDAGENTEIYLKNLSSSSDISGLFIVSTAKRELTVVHIVGKLKAEDAGKLSGILGIPNLDAGKDRK
jgi:hypothetical protein